MERLTESFRNGDSSGISKGSLIDRPGKGYPSAMALAIVTKLAEFEDLDEQGLLLRLPCKVGETVFLIDSKNNIVPRTADMMFLGVLWDEYKKSWFLTRAEAEQKLKEMEDNQN